MTVRCKQCNAEVEDSTPRQPCPQCGSMSRVFDEYGSGGLTLGGTAEVTVVRHWAKLLDAAERLYAANEYGAAVVVAQSACEVVVERAMTKAFALKGIPELADPVTDYLVSFSLRGDKNRTLYDTLAGDDIAQKPFWQGYTQLVKDRHASAHSGRDVPQPDARNDLNAARLFVDHVEQHNGLQ